MTIPPFSEPFWCAPHPPDADPLPRDGRRNCGFRETVLRRQWDPARGLPAAETIAAIDRLAAQPVHIASLVIGALDELWVGQGSVPQLDSLAKRSADHGAEISVSGPQT